MILALVLLAFGLLGFCWTLRDSFVSPIILSCSLIFTGIGLLILAYSVDTSNNKSSAEFNYIEAEPVGYSSTQTFFEDNEGNILTANGNYPSGEYLLTIENDEVLAVWQNVIGGDVG